MAEDQILQVAKGLLEMVGVAGMDEPAADRTLSTGMKRSVAIARALASQPEAVLYDEPTTMVDPLMGHLLGVILIKRLKHQLASDEHRGDARYAVCEEAGGSGDVPASG